MSRRYDAIVVGLGAMGSLACWHLARRGVRVLGLEQFDLAHTMGSSHGLSRMIRKTYHEHDDYIPLLERAYALWAELEAESGEKLLHLGGGLFLGEPDTEAIGGAIRTALRHGLAHEVLDRTALVSRFPQFRLPDNFIGLYEPTAGWLPPERAIRLACHHALLAGAELHGHEPLLGWESSSGGVTLRTHRGTYHADQAVFCGGPWLGELVPELNGVLRVSRQLTGWLWPRSPSLFVPARFPVWSVRHSDGGRIYGFPLTADGPGLKVANHDRSATTDARTVARDLLPGDEETFRAGLRDVLPDADGPLLSSRVCLYTNTPDLNPVVGRHPRHGRAWVAGGFSGHGFKLASAIGAVLADLVLDGRTESPIGFLDPSRFAR